MKPKFGSLRNSALFRLPSNAALSSARVALIGMRLYSREELERLKLIKRLVDDGGINLAGVQRLLSIAEVVQRLRPLMRDDALSARDGRRRLVHELDELSRMLGFD